MFVVYKNVNEKGKNHLKRCEESENRSITTTIVNVKWNSIVHAWHKGKHDHIFIQFFSGGFTKSNQYKHVYFVFIYVIVIIVSVLDVCFCVSHMHRNRRNLSRSFIEKKME